ncbi:alpha-2-macroglobulin family protein [Lutimaribacter sp. EGI FJ00015]|uniref:Alpha-2-macroglobulin family protein n=1 Tax=Lutimaribacter degradans TaxID=2945989 RepID=A0ACC5ZW87_9RHOB|nr:alpha-2-macroglobulin family protein [Lutimaribacter sp. EGI FJ00013]MCM2562582.1 alpha-2-macroglobulin family protein [Lutimaribacter sp. EGI FJ00013]MCO0613739.1 alpha-2-macroglobulin family protein [Lutimaribacter sp. EGI FJ00015]MCO0636778.1 alpha-2-macroglobulin family protein [Lutimaribacter sp. EGI FJ00014]
MRSLFVFLAALICMAGAGGPSKAQDGVALPSERFIVTRDMDFFGGDLQPLFDTTYDACERTCRAQPSCRAFTFNQRSNACFPKTGVDQRQSFEGAISAERRDTPPEMMQRGAARGPDLAFLGQTTLDAARDLAADIGNVHPSGQYTVDRMLEAAQKRRSAQDHINALRWTGGALAHQDRADLWIEYARLARLLPSSGDARVFKGRALSAAVNGYLRAASDGARVLALEVMARVLEDNGRGRDMIPALRLAQSIQPQQDIADMLDDAVGKYGFRITNTRVESDLAAPRFCAEFSEPLARNGVEYADYLRLPSPTMAVTTEGRSLCIAGGSHGERYSVTFRAGLPDAKGEGLIKDVQLRFYVKDRSPQIVFPGRAYMLPRGADAAVPVQTVNLETIDLVLRRVDDRNLLRTMQEGYFGNPLRNWERRDFAGDVGEEVWRGTGQVESRLNVDMTTRLPMGDIVSDLAPGLYALSAAVPGVKDYEDPGATQWFILSDLGLTTMSGTDGLHVFVRGLGDAAPRAGLTVTLVSRANRVLDTAQTDAMGHAVFAAGLTLGTGGAAPALVTVRDGQEDMAFLSLTDPAFDLSDRGVEGREAAPPVDVFLTTDRGAYRAGEVIHATALARDGQAQAITGLPLTAILTRPDGVEYSRHLSAEDVAGGHVFALPVAASAPRGSWSLDIKADPDAPALASTSVLVEDFLPERIEFDLALPDGPLSPRAVGAVTIDARYLFGAPAADLGVTGTMHIMPSRSRDAHPGYLFGRHDDPFRGRSTSIGDARTDAQGRARLSLEFPDTQDYTGPSSARLDVSVTEGSGRPVERSITRELAAANPMIGIRPGFDDVLPQGAAATFSLIATNEALPVEWSLNRVVTRYQWYSQNGDWRWEPVTDRTRVAEGTTTLSEAPTTISAPVDWGRYELVVESAQGAYTASSVDFHAGWYAPANPATTPDMLEVSLDKPGYAPGETAQLRVVPRASGKALITVMSNRLISMQAVELAEGENLIDLPVTDDWGAGVYVAAQAIRPMDMAAGRNPARALGLAHASVDPGDKLLQVSIDAPERADPRGPLRAAVHIDGLAEGETAHVTLAAVDVGILNLTRFDAPDPAGHYFGQRRLGVEIRDVYGRLIDGLNGALGQVRSGGDAGSRMQMQSPPPTEHLVAYFTGPVTVDAEGRAQVAFDLPDFNGTVRLMAVAWSPRAVGQAQADVVVADPVVVTASLPRFLAPGDDSRMLLEIVHANGPVGRMGLDVTADGLTLDAGSIPSEVELAAQGKATLSVPITAGEVGDHSLRVALTTPDGRQLVKTLTLGVRANDPPVSQTRQVALDPGQTLSFDADVLANFRPGTGQAVLSAGPLAQLDVPGLMAQLDRYPYGCTEQVASQALPLLYLSSVADPLGLGDGARIDVRIAQAVERILTRQSSSGAFGLWRADSGDFWLDAYVTDFLSRARARGHDVPDVAFRAALDNLRNRVNYAPDFDQGGEALAYALHVLAREGAAAMGDLRYYADEKAQAFATPLAAAQLGAALAAYGDQTRADAMFGVAARKMAPRLGTDTAPVWRSDYGTNLRDAAGLLALASEAGSTMIDRPALAAHLGRNTAGMSTQEAAWTLMAARALVDDPANGLLLNGQPAPDLLVRRFAQDLGQPLSLANEGDAPVRVTLTTLGVPAQPEPAGGYGYSITRSYYDLDGAQIDPARVAAGTRMVAVLQITPFQETGARLIVDDPLPAGFEIDNPNLLRSGDIRGLDWLEPAGAEHSEFRADRFVAAVDWRSPDPFRLAYILRATTPGRYHHPAATVEDMYRPQYRARTDTGAVQVE